MRGCSGNRAVLITDWINGNGAQGVEVGRRESRWGRVVGNEGL